MKECTNLTLTLPTLPDSKFFFPTLVDVKTLICIYLVIIKGGEITYESLT